METISICWKNKPGKSQRIEIIRKISLCHIDKYFFQCYLYQSLL